MLCIPVIEMRAIHGLVSAAIRPLSGLRGFGRLSGAINTTFLKLGLSPLVIAEMRDGTKIKVDLRSLTEWRSFYSGSYDDHLIDLITEMANGRPVIDVGGNIGMYAVRVAKRTGGLVHCFEPVPQNVKRIRDNAALNDSNVAVHQVALSDEEGEVTIILREDFEAGAETGNASVAISEEADTGFQTITAPMTTLDALNTGPVSVIKVDVEGHEDKFFAGARQTISQNRPVILTEINNWFYEKRGVTSSDTFAATLPDDYVACLVDGLDLKWVGLGELQHLARITNVILSPKERRKQVESLNFTARKFNSL